MPGYLCVTAFGEWTDELTVKILEKTKAESDRLGCTCILLDLRGLTPPKSEMVRFNGGVMLAKIFPPTTKLASLAKAEHITGFGETAAINRGAWFLVFSDEVEAIEWLLAK